MAGFLYWWPGRETGVSRAHAGEAGLAYAFDAELACSLGFGGPDGGKGAVFAQGSTPPKIDLPHQTWRKIPKSPIDAWVGYDNDAKPGPDDLLRAQALPGHDVELLDGRKWHVPVARAVSDAGGQITYRCALPQTLDCNDDGELVVGSVVDRHAPLWTLALTWFDVWSAAIGGAPDVPGEDAKIEYDRTVGEVIADAEVALAANYRVSRAECMALGIFDVEAVTARAVLDALIDMPAMVAFASAAQKKTAESALGISCTDGGPAVDTSATDRPAPTCGRSRSGSATNRL